MYDMKPGRFGNIENTCKSLRMIPGNKQPKSVVAKPASIITNK